MLYTILSYIYEFLSEFLPFFLVLMLFRRKRGKYAATFSRGCYVLPIVFAFYIIAVFHVTGAGTLYDAFNFRFQEARERINLIPFSRKIDTRGYLLNIVMFLPFGFFVPLIWKEMGKISYITLTGLSFSFLIEVSQMLSLRGTDVDDLILNTLGAALGFLLYQVWDRFTRSRYQLDGVDMMELPVYIFTLYLGRCLLFHQLGLIRLVYGY